MDISILKGLGFNDKSANIYLALLNLGPSSVRKLAEKTGFNRGTIYESLKWLQEMGIADYFKKNSHQLFVANDPERLHEMVGLKSEELAKLDKQIEKFVPELKSLYNKDGERPVSRYYGQREIGKILEDVLAVCENSESKEYRIYSSAGIREYLYKDFETFSDVRVSKGIFVKVIAIGDGGELRGLDERRWLSVKNNTPTYILIYPGKTAYVSLDAKGEPVGVVIENKGVYQTQKIIFDQLWKQMN